MVRNSCNEIMKTFLSAVSNSKYILKQKSKLCKPGKWEMLNRNVHTVGVCFGFVLLPMASFRQEGNNVLLWLMKTVCPPLWSCWGVVFALAACSVRIPLCAPRSSPEEAALAWVGDAFPSGEWSGISAPRSLTPKLRGKKNAPCSPH